MKLYYSKGACSLAVRIAINEMGLHSDYEAVDLKTKKTESGEDFLKINPKGYVPALITNDGQLLTEAAVVQQYLADTEQKHQLLPTMLELKRYRVLEWLNFVATEMHKGVGALFNKNYSEETKEKILLPAIKKKLEFLNNHLKDHRFLLGDEFTLADGYLFVILNWVHIFKLDTKEWPNVERYYNEVKQRPAVQKSLKEEKII